MKKWLRVAWVCALAVGCGGSLEEPSSLEESAPAEISGEHSGGWSRTVLGSPYLVEDIFPPPPPPTRPPLLIEGPLPTSLVDFQGTLFFAANFFPSGESALWRSDGTAPGTFAVREFSPPRSVDALTVVGDRLFFIVRNELQSHELWVSDGTPSGTRLLKDISPGPEDSFVEGLTRVGETLFFYHTRFVGRTDRAVDLWKSDGTTDGTVRLKELGPGHILLNLTALGEDTLFFTLIDTTHGHEPWVSDGTASGTRLLRDIHPGPAGSGVRRPTLGKGVLYFSAQEPLHGRELWRTDGTPEGTVLVEDTVPGPEGSGAEPLGVFMGRLYFVTFEPADRGARLRTLNPFRPRPPPSRIITDLPNPFPEFPQVSAFLPSGGVAWLNGRVLFTLAYATGGPALADVQLWSTRGTGPSTVLLRRRLLNAIDLPETTLTAVDPHLALFAAADAEHGQEPWVTDGTPEGTRLLMDIRPGSGSSYPIDFTRSGDFMFFVANDGVHFHELWAVPVGRSPKNCQTPLTGSP